MERVTIYLGLGSNMGDRLSNLQKTLDLLSQVVTTGKISSVYETEPLYNTKQPRFLNMVCQCFTTFEPLQLLAVIKKLEQSLGRPTAGHNLPRPIDIDILFYGDLTTNTPELTIPHPLLAERAFVLVPLAEISPDLRHPVTGKTVSEILKSVSTAGVNRRLEKSLICSR